MTVRDQNSQLTSQPKGDLSGKTISKTISTVSAIAAMSLGLIAGSGLLWSSQAKAQLIGNLTVKVDNLRDRQGQVCFNLFKTSDGFPSDRQKAVKTDCIKISDQPLEIKLNSLPYGNYAISLYHDRNGDRTLNRAAFGMPSEGYGFSNNPSALTGPANFGQSMFILAGRNTNVKVNLFYPN
jgi:uncharacterized protein (DUF2141 family)